MQEVTYLFKFGLDEFDHVIPVFDLVGFLVRLENLPPKAIVDSLIIDSLDEVHFTYYDPDVHRHFYSLWT